MNKIRTEDSHDGFESPKILILLKKIIRGTIRAYVLALVLLVIISFISKIFFK